MITKKDFLDACPNVLKILENSVKYDKVSHAYLFTGPKGTYKKEMAYHLALMLYCGIDPCYKCQACEQILSSNHLNITYIEPIGQSVKKEQILALQDEFSKTSQIPGPRIYIINEADTMTDSAANSLLKFIEEPVSDNTIGILITEHEDNILSTIKSRSVVINFPPLDSDKLFNTLKENGVEERVASCISNLTSNIDEANLLIEDESFNNAFEVFNNFVELRKEGRSVSLFYRDNKSLLASNKGEKRGNTIRYFLALLEDLYRDIVEYTIHGSNYSLKPYFEQIKVMREYDTLETLTEKISKILELEKRLSASINIDPNMDMLMFELNGGEF